MNRLIYLNYSGLRRETLHIKNLVYRINLIKYEGSVDLFLDFDILLISLLKSPLNLRVLAQRHELLNFRKVSQEV